MSSVKVLIDEVSFARTQYLSDISEISEEQSAWKPGEDQWNVIQITEHLFWAEHGGILGMWKTLHALRAGTMLKTYESVHRDMPIEQIIELTWKPKEIVPAVAAPRLGGPISFWKAALDSLQEVLEQFGQDLQEEELRVLAHPHPISGPMDFHQRLEFLRFHLDRHRRQVSALFSQRINTDHLV